MSFSILETKHVIKILITDFIVTTKVLIVKVTHLDSSNSKCVFQVGSQSEGDFFRNAQTSAFLEADVVVDMNNLENTTTENKLDLYMNMYNLQLD